MEKHTKMSYKLFLDDFRDPIHCALYMYKRIGSQNSIYTEDWIIVKNYHEFVEAIKKQGLPEVVSFDHDLSEEHYWSDGMVWEEYYQNDQRVETGYDCAKWLIEYCDRNSVPLPEIIVHSMNPVGTENIKNLFNDRNRIQKNQGTQSE